MEEHSTDIIKKVNFRDLVDEIPSTTYATHHIHYYPAKFVPHVVRYCIKTYLNSSGKWILDPFAGSGTTAVEALITGNNATLVDINPITKYLTDAKTLILDDTDLAKKELERELQNSLKYDKRKFKPKWGNIEYWYPSQVLEFLENLWGYIHYECSSTLKPILLFAALKLTRALSYTDDVVPKLYKSQQKVEKLQKLLRNNSWREYVIYLYKKTAQKYLDAVLELNLKYLRFHKVRKPEVFAPQDIEKWEPYRTYDMIITSPPYMQAQEYIRSSKIDLYWLGWSDKKIRKLSSLEIPYRRPQNKITTPTIEELREKIKEKGRDDLVKIVDSYFSFVLKNLYRLSSSLIEDGHICIFVGSPKVAGISVDIWKILIEYFTSKNQFRVIKVLEDTIKVSKLFKGRKNMNPNGIKSEYLVILKKE